MVFGNVFHLCTQYHYNTLHLYLRIRQNTPHASQVSRWTRFGTATCATLGIAGVCVTLIWHFALPPQPSATRVLAQSDPFKAKIPGMFKGSTESVIKAALPQLIRMDGYFMPTVLPFHVSPPSILAPFLAIERGCHKSSLFCRCPGCRRGCLRRRCGMCSTAHPTSKLLRRPMVPSSIMC